MGLHAHYRVLLEIRREWDEIGRDLALGPVVRAGTRPGSTLTVPGQAVIPFRLADRVLTVLADPGTISQCGPVNADLTARLRGRGYDVEELVWVEASSVERLLAETVVAIAATR